MTDLTDEDLREIVVKLSDKVENLEQQVQAQNIRLQLLENSTAQVSTIPKTSTPAIPVRPISRKEPVRKTSLPSWNDEQLESRIGGTWLNRIGVIAFVLGMAFFLKYAFENNWIGPAGRVALGILIGVALLTGGELAQKKLYDKFAQGITGGGIAILYISIFAAYSFYQLVPQLAAFALMVLVTSTAVLLAVRYNAMAIAVLAVLGGFLTPFLLSTGKVNVVGLFTYIAILDLGILGTAYFKNWRPLNYLSYTLTQAVIIAWLFHPSSQVVWTQQLILTIFFIIFALLSFVYNILHRSKTQPADLLLILLNAGLYYFLSYQNLEPKYHAFLGFFALFMALIYFSLGFLTLRINREDQNLTLTFLGVSLIFLTVAIPIQLTGHWITVGWAVEGAVLIWLGFKTENLNTRYGAWLILALVGFRLLGYDTSYDWNNYYLYSREAKALAPYLPFWNAKTLTFFVSILAFFGSSYLYAQYKVKLAETETKAMTVFAVTANLLVLWLLSTEIANYFDYQILVANYQSGVQSWDNEEAKQLTLSAVWTFYSILLISIGFIKKHKPTRFFAIILFGLTILKVFLYDLSRLDTIYRILSFIILGVILMLVSFLYQKYKEQITEFID